MLTEARESVATLFNLFIYASPGVSHAKVMTLLKGALKKKSAVTRHRRPKFQSPKVASLLRSCLHA